ncbi:RWD domain-containing protein [Zea mays]|uniref:RWD domain-containing protein n=1 Tax=Zea mays TaxID=4577 RepID=A0A1D6QKV0_MAIZE|nr:RWD domain-containing protein [Zea mays]
MHGTLFYSIIMSASILLQFSIVRNWLYVGLVLNVGLSVHYVFMAQPNWICSIRRNHHIFMLWKVRALMRTDRYILSPASRTRQTNFQTVQCL